MTTSASATGLSTASRPHGIGALVYRNTLALSIANYVGAGCNLLAAAIMARQLGVERFGALSGSLVAAFLAFQIGEFGIAQIVTKRLARARHQHANDFSRVFSLRAALAGFILVAISTGSLLFPALSPSQPLLMLVALAFTFEFLTDLSVSILRSRERLPEEALLNTVRSVMLVVGSVVWILAAAKAGPWWTVAFVFVAASLIKWIVSLAMVRPIMRLDFGTESRALWRELLIESVPLGTANLLTQLVLRLDTLFIFWLRGDREAGLYSAAYSIFLGTQLVWNAFLVSLFAHAARRFPDDPASFWAGWRRALVQVSVLTTTTGLGLSIFGGFVITLIYGSRYLDGASVLPLLLTANVLLALNSLCGMALIVSGSSVPIVRAHMFAFLLYVPLSLSLVSRYGFVGSGLAAVATHSVMFIVLIRALAVRRAALAATP